VTDPRYALLAARLLRRSEPGLARSPEPGAPNGNRERGLLSIERALDAGRRTSRRSALIGFAAVASVASVAAGGLGWLVLHSPSEEPSLQPIAARVVVVVASPLRDGASFLDSNGEVPLGASVRLFAGGRIATAPGGGARLQLSTGTRLELQPLTTLTLQSHDALQRFALTRGGLEARVAKLAPDERFVIDTPDEQVEVRGTEFHLEVLSTAEACGGGSRTRLEVTEGVVEVRSSGALARVAAGQHWPSDCEPPAPNAAAAAGGTSGGDAGAPGPRQHGVAGARASQADRRAAPRPRSARPERAARSLIAEQNVLFQRGVEAQRQGQAEQALAAYAELIERFPSSPLAENAAVARIRLSLGADPARARREAANYLARYPRGFARREAQRIAEEP
jgi:hypothetical protein